MRSHVTDADPVDDEEILLRYDENHGIPDLSLIDIVATKNGTTHLLEIVVSKPLDSCRKCQLRLAHKIENYLIHINADSIIGEWGKPNSGNTQIRVVLPEHCDPVTFSNLEKLTPWAAEHGAALSYIVNTGSGQS